MEHLGTALPLPRVYLDPIVDTEQDEEESLQMEHTTATAIAAPLLLPLSLLMHCDYRQLEPHRLHRQLLISSLPIVIVSLKDMDIVIIIPSRRSAVVATGVHPSNLISCYVGCVTRMSVRRYEDAVAVSVGRLAHRIST
jgi:hypothetical protein